MTVESRSPDKSLKTFSLRDTPLNVFVLRDPNGMEHVRFYDAGRSIQLVCRGVSILSETISLYIPYAELRQSKETLLTLKRLIALDRNGEFPSSLFNPHPRARHVRFALQALDGDLAGAHHREIAEAILGPEAVAEGWSGTTRYAKSQFYRYLNYGRALIEGKYLELLR